MNQDPEAVKQGSVKPPKKAYTKPACVSEQIFETTALACGKQPGRGGSCVASPRLS